MNNSYDISMINRIQALEERISFEKKELNELIHDCMNNSNVLTQGRLNELEREIHYMSQQLEALKLQFGNVTSSDIDSSTVPPATNFSTSGLVDNQPDEPIHKLVDMPVDRPVDITIDKSVVYNTFKEPKKEFQLSDLESVFGKSLMGIFASVLIFISLIFFGTLLIPLINDVVKQVLMYLVSFAFAGFGLYRLQQNSSNKLNISLVSCGMGAIYISLFMSNLYFRTLNDIALYLILIVWCAGICYLSRYQSIVFQSIGQIGTIIATLFGILYCQSVADNTMLLFLTIFLIVTELIYSIYFDRLPYANLVINGIGVLCSTVLFMFHYDFGEATLVHFLDGGDTMLLCICRIMLLCLILFSMMILIFKHNPKITLANIIGNIVLILLVFLQTALFADVHLIGMAIDSIILLGIELSHRNEEKKLFSTQLTIFIMFTIVWFNCGLIKDEQYYLYAAGFTCITLLYGILKDKLEYKFFGFFWLFWMVVAPEGNLWIYTIVSLVVYGLIIGFAHHANRLTTRLRSLFYLASMATIFHYLIALEDYFYEHDIRDTIIVLIALFIYFVYNLAMRFYRGGLVSRRLTTIVNGIIMFVISFVLAYNPYDDNALLHFLLVLLAIACFSVNCKSLLEKENKLWGFYLGFKYTLLLYMILNSFSIPNPVISIACLILAILLIIVGFRLEYKILRIYGLTLSLISIIKLVLLDIEYSGTTARAFSFFICGILCFIVSAIYNRVDKQMS